MLTIIIVSSVIITYILINIIGDNYNDKILLTCITLGIVILIIFIPIKYQEDKKYDVNMMIIKDASSSEERQLQIIGTKKTWSSNDYSTLIKFIDNPSEKVQILAINININNVDNIENLTENAQLAVIRKDPNYLIKIKNPTKKVVDEAYFLLNK